MLDESEKLIVTGDWPASFCTIGTRQEESRVQCLRSYMHGQVSFQKRKTKDYSLFLKRKIAEASGDLEQA